MTVRHEGKPSGFGRVRFDCGVMPYATAPNSGDSEKAFPARGGIGFKPSRSQS